MKRIRSLVAVALLSGLGILSVAFTQQGVAQEKKGPNVQDPPKGVKESEKTKAIHDLDLAARLIQYGRSQKHAESLLIAAQIIHKTPTEKLTVGSKVTGDKDKTAGTPAAKVDDSPKALVAEAKKMSSSAQVESLAAATLNILGEASRGASGGPWSGNFIIYAYQTVTWDPMTFNGLETAVVRVNNRVHGAMVLEVVDQFGSVVARDNIPATFYQVAWFPLFPGTYTIRLRNLDSIAFNCTLLTN
jgi:hypothetical protein